MAPNNQMNFQNKNKISQPIKTFLEFNQLNEEEDEEEEADPILDGDDAELNTINSFNLTENTALIIKKSLVKKNGF
jgi:hypothetical protein